MKELNVGDWYYLTMGYGGSRSQFCSIRRKTGRQSEKGVMSLFGHGDGMKVLPVCDIYEAVDESGAVHKVTANDLAANGRVGIGTLDEPRFGHVASIFREDARLLVETGKYTEEEITAEFPFAFKPYEEEANEYAGRNIPMTDKQEEILRAAYAANCEKEKREREEANRKFAAEVAELRKKFSYIPCPKTDGKYLSVGDKRRNVLAVLKHEFPGVKFKAHTRNGSTSDSITVEYEDGPALGKVNAVMVGFETTEYNGYEDIHEPVTRPASVVCGGFDYVFVHRNTSKPVSQYIQDWIKSNVSGASDEYIRTKAVQILNKSDLPITEYDIMGLTIDHEGEWTLVVKVKEVPKQSKECAMTGSEASVTYNEQKGGIEIRFPYMPSDEIRQYLKDSGYRWSKFGKCWWIKDTQSARESAEKVKSLWKNIFGAEVA